MRFFSIIGSHKTVDNPISLAKVDLVIDALGLNSASRVLDIACGKGEMLCRIAERYGASGTGVDVSPHFCAEARQKAESRGLSGLITIEEISGDAFTAPEATFDATMCVGGEWVFGGWTGTLAQLQRWAKPGATVVAGTPYWISPPPASYLEATGLSGDSFTTHAENVRAGEELGLNLLFSVASNQDDWDNYMGLSWRAAYDFVRDNPGDADASEVEALTAADKKTYFEYARDGLGWAIYVFRRS